MQAIQGLHHLTAMAGDPQRNLDFYTQVLGQRLVKVTVNFDDPGTYHFYFGDELGTPGTVMTFFPWRNAKRGRRGNGEVAAAAYAAPPGSLDAWRARLGERGVAFTEGTRFGRPFLAFEDPDGLRLELLEDEAPPAVRPWPNNPVPPEAALRGFHSVTLWVDELEGVARLLESRLGFTRVGEEPDPEGRRTRYRGAAEGLGVLVDVVERPGQPRGQFGAGSVHHVALRTRDDAEQAEYRESLRLAGYEATPVRDRQYFRSVYFRDFSGVLFEIATEAPGFAADETVDELGSGLKLPAWLEPRRAGIEARVPRIVSPEYGAPIPKPTPEGSGDDRAAPRLEGPHQGGQVYAAGVPLGEARFAAVLVHGRGANAEDMLGLANAIQAPGYAFLLPEASGGAWYPRSFLAPLEENEPYLSSALLMLEDVLFELDRQGIPRENVVLGGFSQGACLALEFAARNPRRYGGVFALSG
ncbi:MAG TPA: VOC family protein, partial [Deinococcales bacterium]|nr:VOC family protein [Deinococcales bacterium]